MKISLCFLLVHFSCFAMDDFLTICTKDAHHDDCLEYEKRALDHIICRWQHFFPSLREFDLKTEKNPLYTFSLPYCDAWIKSEASSLIPDVEGRYCVVDAEVIDPNDPFPGDPKRRALCKKYWQAEMFLKIKALRMLSEIKVNYSTAARATFQVVIRFLMEKKKEIEQKDPELQSLEYVFPSRIPHKNLGATISSYLF